MDNIKNRISQISALTLCALTAFLWLCTEMPDYENWRGWENENPLPGTPSGVTAAAISPNSITVSWPRVPEANGYYIYRSSSSSGTYNQVGSSSTTAYIDSVGLSAGQTYYYKVEAYNSAGRGGQSSYISATTLSNPTPVTYKVTVTSYGTSASGNGDYVPGEKVTISAGTPPEGQRFKSWTTASNGVIFVDSTSSTTTFIMPGNAVAVTANFVPTYAVTVSAGNGASGNGNYAEGDTVTIKAGTPPSDRRFKNWTTTSARVKFANANDSMTTFIMPGNTVTVTANFEDIYGSFSYGGQTYKQIKIGNQTWMAENLNVETTGSWCYDNANSNCARYGRLYTWEAAKSACSSLGSGWHLPSSKEWDALMTAVGGSSTAGTKLKTSDWGGTNDYGFSALPGGCYIDGSFYNLGSAGLWWSESELNASNAWHRYMYSYSGYTDVYESSYGKSHGVSVRCVRD